MEVGTDIRDALGHPLRQELLAMLAASPEGLSLAELARRFPHLAISAISYHLRLLGTCGTASATWQDGSQTWRYGVDYARV
ncbi:MAG TPA: helix-turn-helix domain-containing protein [Solirubrobacterales bacterium]